MKRREFFTLLGGAVAAAPFAAHAQQPMPVVGFLNPASRESYEQLLQAFRRGLGERGFVEGRNVSIDYRWAENQYDQLAPMAAELVRREVAVIVAVPGIPPAMAAKAATKTIPIVFFTGGDPVALGFVASLNRPGGNLTGITTLGVEVGPKRLEVLHELMPDATAFALLVNPTNPALSGPHARDLQAAAGKLGLKIEVLEASTERGFDAVFAMLVERRARELIIAPDPFFIGRSRELAARSLRHAVPAIYQYREFVEAGGLMSYGASNTEQYRQIGVYAGRILAGEKPADLPVQQSTKVELIINMKTAKALGLTVPISLLGRADEVIE